MMPTPFEKNGGIAWQDIHKLVDAQIACGAHGLSLLGLGGEASMLSLDERRSVTERALSAVNGQTPVIVGVASDEVSDSVFLAQHAVEKGAAAIMVAPPSAGINSIDTLFEFFESVAAAASGVDVMIQDAPQYLGTEIGATVFQRIASEIDNVNYIKTEALPACDAIVELRQVFDGSDIKVFGGQAGINFIDVLEAGGAGIIPGCEATRLLVEIWNQYELSDDKTSARELFRTILPMFVFEMQTLGQFILCTKQALFRQGLLSDAKARIEARLSPISNKILNRHLDELFDLERQIFG